MTLEPHPHLATLDRASEDMRGRERFVRLDRNERVSPFSDEEFAAMMGAVRPEMLCAYPDPSPLIERLAPALGVPTDWIALTNGSDAAIRKVLQTFVRDGDRVVLAEPSYAMYPIYTRMFGGIVDHIPYDQSRRLDINRFIAQLGTTPRIAAIACPDQPTGAVLDLATIRDIAAAAASANVLLLIDEAYYPFHPTTAVGLIHEFDNVVVTRTFSKVGGLAGLRLGYLIGRPAVLALVERVRGAHEVNAAAIQIGAFIMDHPEIGDRYMREVEAGRALLANAASALGLGFLPTPANFQLLELPAGIDPSQVASALKDRGYLVKAGFAHPSVARCIRVTLAGPAIIGPFTSALRAACAHAAV